MSESSGKVTIIVAVISLVTSIVVALISNWDKLFPSSAPQTATMHSPGTSSEPAAQAASPVASQPTTSGSAAGAASTPTSSDGAGTVSVAGQWHDPADPQLSNRIEQSGTSISFLRQGYLSNGVWVESRGNGIVQGSSISLQYRADYSTQDVSSGQCNGTVNSRGTRMDVYCTDSLMGGFPVSLSRR